MVPPDGDRRGVPVASLTSNRLALRERSGLQGLGQVTPRRRRLSSADLEIPTVHAKDVTPGVEPERRRRDADEPLTRASDLSEPET